MIIFNRHVAARYLRNYCTASSSCQEREGERLYWKRKVLMYGSGFYGEYSEDDFLSNYRIKWRSESARFPIFKIAYTVSLGRKSSFVSMDAGKEESERVRKD